MTAYSPPPTRMELLGIKRRIVLYERVHRILKLKLEGLIIEAQKQVAVLAREKKDLARSYLASQEILVEAIMIEGEHELSLAAYAVEGEPLISVENLLEEVIRTAGTETRVKLLLREIDRTRLIVNSLENRLIPNLYNARHRGELFRDELELEEYTRLFRIKKIRQKQEMTLHR
jgi:V/A-type H+-transporting ATPase subunit D